MVHSKESLEYETSHVNFHGLVDGISIGLEDGNFMGSSVEYSKWYKYGNLYVELNVKYLGQED